MLQGLNLPFLDLNSLQNGANPTLARPAADAASDAGFAAIFRLEPARIPPTLQAGGMPLPIPGNVLPSGDTELAAEWLPENDSAIMFWSGSLPVDPLTTAPLPAATLTTSLATTAAASSAAGYVEAGSPPGFNAADSTATAERRLLQPAVLAAQAGTQKQSLSPPTAAPVNAEPAPQLPAASHSEQLMPLAQAAAQTAVPNSSPLSPAASTAGKRTTNDGAARVLPPDGVLPLPTGLDDTTLDTNLNRLPQMPTQPSLAPLAPVAGDIVEEFMRGQLTTDPALQAMPVAARAGVEVAVTPAPAAASIPTVPAISTPVQDAAWGDRVGERLLMMADNKSQVAEIRLSPAELGPLRVRIAIEDGATSVTFHAQHAVTREALEHAMPRLREMLADNGLTLEESHIADPGGQELFQGKPEQHAAAPRPGELAIDATDDVPLAELSQEFRRGSRTDQLLDTFA